MTTIRLVFAAGRYHGTPWGRHVNEGVPEWPPSPYRLLRALYDVWQRKCADLPEQEIRKVLEGLAASAPRFTLPAAVSTHTRSYLSANAKDPTDKNLVLDSFLVFDRPHACYLSWPELDLTPASSHILRELLSNLNFLGRSESWVEAELWWNTVEGPHSCHPAGEADSDGEMISVACASPPTEAKGKPNWLDALTFSTSNLLREKASSPPLLRQVRYVRSQGAIQTDPVPHMVRKTANIQALLLGLDATVLPLVTTTLEVAEQIRVRLMGAHKRRMGNDETRVSSVFSGKTENGERRLDHGHVYILPLASRHHNKEGRIDRVLILNPLQAFDESELDAIRGVRELYQRDGRPSVRCVVTWQGSRDDPAERKSETVLASTTPFVPPHHWRKGRDFEKFLIQQAERECRNHRIGAAPSKVEVLNTLPGLFDVVEYRRNRKDDPVRPGYALRITFSGAVLAPFAIGYGAHFGLGQFQPEESNSVDGVSL
jgi:CRISPR-associated protein Csb2